MKEHLSGAEGLAPSLTSATYCVTLGKVYFSVVRVILTSKSYHDNCIL